MIELNNLYIETKVDVPYLQQIIDYINEHEKEILDFFRIDKLDIKYKLIFMPFKEFYDYMIEKTGKYYDYMAGAISSSEKIIRSLTIEDQRKYTKHKDADINKINKMIIHELVHACYAQVVLSKFQPTWFNEGLATNLAHQDRELKDLHECDFRALTYNFTEFGEGNYSYSYTIVKYILENYDKEEIYRLVVDSEYLKENYDKIFNEATMWVDQQRKM